MADELKKFVSYMREFEDISLASRTLEQEDDPDKKDKAKSYLDERGLQTIQETLGDRIDISTLSLEEKEEYAKQGVGVRQRILIDSSGRVLSSGLENVLKEIDPKALEELVLRKELREPRSEEHKKVIDNYAEMLEKYGGYLSAKRLESKYKSGDDLDKNEIQGLRGSVAEVVGNEIREQYKGQFSQDTLNSMVEVAKRIIATHGIDKKEYLDQAVGNFVAEREKEFRDYEAKSGKKVINYVKESLKALRDDKDPQDSMIARNLIYEATKTKKAP